MVAREGGRTLIIWRHGETAHNASGIWQGQLDTALSDTGREQAHAAAEALVAYSPSVIVSSDLQRAALAAGEDIRRGTHGESLRQVAGRTRAAVDELLAQVAPGDCAVVATHGVSARAVVASLVGLDQHLAWQCIAGLHNCHWAELHEYDSAWRIVAWNVGTDPV